MKPTPLAPTYEPSRLRIEQTDITKLATTAIVNAANSSLLGGGGVDGAIHRAGGPEILEECRKIRARQGGCKTGEAVITTGGRLPAGYVIHTVGPVWNGGLKGEPELLASCYRNSLRIAAEHKLDSVGFPGISTGIYGYPKEEAAAIAVREVQQWLAAHEWPKEVVLVAFDGQARQLYERQLASGS
ncbi:O-acetyl-ADP-ribose deacetylase [Hymenobacter sp. BRD67]|uniref:O-acetyl-ADP-ribose deacetylase n=1 Tax=Hymenobacter sp. BRD67 TaxID=2675877 RepID=UPI00156650AA|nr:O-acetyl-ADP-ribose deacetylase [Hymenobacter sp. BRD67]QKG51560.1 O-acetyl-ADP-ribose deacetylase [Hymenobacter sp. BRD67]